MDKIESRILEEIIALADFNIQGLWLYIGNNNPHKCLKCWTKDNEEHVMDALSDIVELVSDFSRTWILHIQTDMFVVMMINQTSYLIDNFLRFRMTIWTEEKIYYWSSTVNKRTGMINIGYSEFNGENEEELDLPIGEGEKILKKFFHKAFRENIRKMSDEKRIQKIHKFVLNLIS